MLEWLPDCDVVQFYGMTEAAPTVTQLTGADHRERPDRLGSMGAPVAGVQVEVRDAIGGVGELWVRGANVMLGYWNRPGGDRRGARRRLVPHGRPGADDEDGYLYMVDRAKDMIITGAENVYSVEVEAVLTAHEAVSEARSSASPTSAGAKRCTPSSSRPPEPPRTS